MEKIKKYILLFGVTVVIIIVAFSIVDRCFINTGNLIIIGCTLIVLMFYAKDTNRLANDTNRLANIQQNIYYTPNVIHDLTAVEIKNGDFDIGFDLINFSSFYVKAFVNIKMKCYTTELIVNNDAYYGKIPWNIPPHKPVHGHFSLNDELLAQAHRTLSEIRKIKEDPELLTISILVNCTSHHNIELKCPEIKYHFVFDRNDNNKNWSGWVLNI